MSISLNEINFGENLLVLDSKRRGLLILYKRYHAELAGSGSAVGGIFDRDCQRVQPVGDLVLTRPESAEERQRAYALRRQWIRLARQITVAPMPRERARQIFHQFDYYFGVQTTYLLPDEAFALLVGLFPQTIGQLRPCTPITV